jgi:hypothetical protein
LIRKLIVAMVAAAMLVAMALPAFAQFELLSPEANATAANAAEQNAAQEQNATLNQDCINVFNQEINQSAEANVTQNNVFGDNTSTVNQEQNAANVAIGVEQENKCTAVIAQEQDLSQKVRQEALAAAAAALGEAGIEF